MPSLAVTPNLAQTGRMIPQNMVIPERDVQVDIRAMVRCSPSFNVVMGQWKGHPARFIEKRQLARHSWAGVTVRTTLSAQAALRHRNASTRHVPVAGVYQAGNHQSGRTFLVEAPYHYMYLEEYLAATPDVDGASLFKQAVEIVKELHCKGLVHGSVAIKAFVVDPSGRLCLAQFENMRIENPSAPFLPIDNLSASEMSVMAPELLQSLSISDGTASLSRAADIYGLGCFGYELLTGVKPFQEYTQSVRPALAQFKLINAVVNSHERPERRTIATGFWRTLEACWASYPASRPSADDLLQRLETLA